MTKQPVVNAATAEMTDEELTAVSGGDKFELGIMTLDLGITLWNLGFRDLGDSYENKGIAIITSKP